MKFLKNKIAVTILLLFIMNFNFVHGQVISHKQKVQNLVDSVNVNNIITSVTDLCWAGGNQSRVTFTPGNYIAADYIAQYFESLPGILSVTRDTFNLVVADPPYDTYPLINIIATIDGLYPDSGMILLGGHYDASGSRESNWSTHWNTLKAQGADDNATGVAALMEVARILSDPVNNFEHTKTIKFIAFAAEEYHPKHSSYHHVGSLYDAQKSSQSNVNLDAVLVLDMIGYNPITDYVEVISNYESLWLTSYVYDSINLYVPGLITNSTPANVPYSDHDSYQQFGFSAILMMENDSPWNNDPPNYQLNPYYHSIGDTIGTLNFSVVKKVTQSALATIAHLSNPVISGFEFEEPVSVTDKFNLNVFPNPFNASTTISFNLKKQSNVNINIYNLSGQKITELAKDKHFNKGRQRIQWNANYMATGVYILNIHSDLVNINHKLLLIK